MRPSSEGIKRFHEFPQTQVLHRLFECRSRMLNGELGARNAASFLSGLLIASDVSGALQVFADSPAKTPLRLIGEPRLTQLYATAFQHQVMRRTAVGWRRRLARRSEPRAPTHRVPDGNECGLNRLPPPNALVGILRGVVPEKVIEVAKVLYACRLPRHRSASQFAAAVCQHFSIGRLAAFRLPGGRGHGTHRPGGSSNSCRGWAADRRPQLRCTGHR